MKVYLLCDKHEAEEYQKIVDEGANYPKNLPRHFVRRNCGAVLAYHGVDIKRQAMLNNKTHVVTLNIASLASAVWVTSNRAQLSATYPDQYESVKELAAVC